MVKAVLFCVAFGLSSAIVLVKNNASLSTRQASYVPKKSKMVMVFRGESFRTERKTKKYSDKKFKGRPEIIVDRWNCDESAIDLQLEDSMSFVEKVIEPLEELGNEIDVIITDEKCPLTKKIVKVFGDRVVSTETLVANGQSENIHLALETLNTYSGGIEHVKEKYDYVFVFRHDLRVYLNVYEWDFDWSSINFFARCEDTASEALGGVNCVWDVLHAMPGRLYEVFYGVIGSSPTPVSVNGEEREFSCFDLEYEKTRDRGAQGHPCYYPMKEALREAGEKPSIGFMKNDNIRVRAHNDYLDMPIQGIDLSLEAWPVLYDPLEDNL